MATFLINKDTKSEFPQHKEILTRYGVQPGANRENIGSCNQVYKHFQILLLTVWIKQSRVE